MGGKHSCFSIFVLQNMTLLWLHCIGNLYYFSNLKPFFIIIITILQFGQLWAKIMALYLTETGQI